MAEPPEATKAMTVLSPHSVVAAAAAHPDTGAVPAWLRPTTYPWWVQTAPTDPPDHPVVVAAVVLTVQARSSLVSGPLLLATAAVMADMLAAAAAVVLATVRKPAHATS